MRSTVADQVLQMAYETEYGIFDHESFPDQPLALVKQHDKEDVVEGSALYAHIRKFFHYRMHKHFGVSLPEFLDLPPHVCDLLYDIVQYDTIGGEKEHRNLERQLQLDLEDQ